MCASDDLNNIFIFGILYGGNSRMNELCLLGMIVLSNILTITIPIRLDNRYRKNIKKTFSEPKNAPPSTAKTGSFALHDIKGVQSTVFNFTCLLSRFSAVINAVAVHPKPIRNVKTLFPDKPTF